MKKKILQFFLVAIAMIFAGRSNAQGGTLSLNSTVNGNISTNTPDTWDLTTTADGQLQLSLSSVGASDLYLTLYDNDGTTVLQGPLEAFATLVAAINADGLAPGTYHITIKSFSLNVGFGSYTLSNTFTAAETANDAEPNGTSATAVDLPLNSSKTGHVGYVYNGLRDQTDWYKVTTDADGLLTINLSTVRGSAASANTLDVNVTLYDNDGITQLGAVEVFNGNGPATNSIYADGLQPGTYYIKIQPYATSEFANYTISNTLTPAILANDAEPNGSVATALNLPVNGSSTGHAGYYYNAQRDTTDWYKVTTTADGLLTINLSTVRGAAASTNTLDVNVTLYDHDGTTQLGAVEVYNGNGPATNSIHADGLQPGTYYIKIQPYATSEFANYTISNTLTPAILANDAEPNGSAVTALNLPVNGSSTGHVGYYYNALRDTSDWYKITTTANGLLEVTLSTQRGSAISNNALDVNVTLYDNDGTTQLGAVEVFNGNGPGTNKVSVDGLAPGTYYVKLQSYATSEFANYTISNIFTSSTSSDTEPNGSTSTAIDLPLNSSKTGNVGYYANSMRDTSDWYKVSTNADGLLRVYLSTSRGSATATNTLDVNVTLYDNDGSTQLGAVEVFNGNGPGTNLITKDGLAPGTYYIKVQPYATSEFANYTITDSLFLPALTSEGESNGSSATASALAANTSRPGHVGYYYNHQRDTVDWYKLITTAAGPVSISLSTAPGSIYSTITTNPLDVNVTLYDQTGVTQLGAVEVFNGYSPGTGFITKDPLPAGTYYIKVQPYSTDEFAAYTIGAKANVGSALTLSSVITNAACFGQTGSVIFTASGGQAPYTYYLFDLLKGTVQSNTTGTFSNLPAGDYSDSVVDANKQYVTGPITITQPAQLMLPPIVASGGTTVCSGATVTLTDAMAGGSWSSSDPLLASVTTSGQVHFGTPISTTTVTIHYVVTNTSSCSAVASITFTVNPPAAAGTISGNQNVCVGKTTALSVNITGGSWSTSSSHATVNPNTGVVTGVSAGTATIVYAQGSGTCMASASTIVTVIAVPSVAAITGNGILQKGTSIQLYDATSGGIWVSSNVSICSVNTNGKVKGIDNGNCIIYYVVSNTAGCSDSAKKQLTVAGVPIVKSHSDKIQCFGETTTLTIDVTGGSGSYQYKLNNGEFQPGNTFTVKAGVYLVWVKDNNSNLYGTTLAFVTEPLPLVLHAVKETDATNGLSNGSFTVIGFGGDAPYQYSVDNGSTFQSTGKFNNLGEGTYHVSIKDDRGCTKLNATTVKVDNHIIKGNGDGDGDDHGHGHGIRASLYPNPTQSYFTLEINSAKPQTVDIQVVDFMGHVVYHAKGSTTNKFKFGEGFSKGTYFIRISADNDIKILKGIKQ